jgi:glutamate-1-semialdehyde aminotransferase
MDQDTIIASLKNDLSKLEKHINNLNTDLRVAYEEKRTVEMIYSMYKKETERDYATLKQAFIDLLDNHFQYKYKSEDINKSEIKGETYVWMEKSGLL